MSHEAKNAEDDETAEDGRGAVAQCDDDGVAIEIILEFVIRCKRNRTAQTNAGRIEDLNYYSY